MKYIFTLAFLLVTALGIAQNQIRYATPIFKDYNLYENIVYAESIPYTSSGQKTKKLYTFDFYEPANDNVSERPIILLFSDGEKKSTDEQDEIIDLCKALTSYGYTCACVSYRQGYNKKQPNGINQAILRGVQDARAAIRYLIEHQKTFRINPKKIYIGGNRSGGTIALYTAFLDLNEITQVVPNARCLDCVGNPYMHQVKVAGVINIDGVIYNRNLINNNDISILNLNIKNDEVLESNLENNSANLSASSRFNSSPNNLHLYLDSLKFQTRFQQLLKTNSTVFSEIINEETITIAAFLNTGITFRSPLPEGKTIACVNATSVYKIPYEKNCTYDWIIENGKIVSKYRSTVEVKWNANAKKGKVSVIKTDASGAKGQPSESLIVEITPQPFADLELEYLSDNTIKIKDKSLDANLLSIDFGFEGMMYQGKPQTNAYFTYHENGTFFITQNVENACGIASQSIPVEVSSSMLYRNSNIQKVLNTFPFLIEVGKDTTIDVSQIMDINELMVTIKNTNDEILAVSVYRLDTNDKQIPLSTSSLKPGIYFIEFSSNENILASKRIRIK